MQSRSRKILDGIIRTKRVANGYIFTGGDNKTKKEAAIFFAKSLNCTGDPVPCGSCLNCKKADKNVHPDIVTIEKDKSSLKIEQVRDLKELTRYGPSEGAWQVVIINEADTMTIEAANSFLKLLEEPQPNIVFILIADRERNLPKTIESRCQKVLFEESELSSPPPEISDLYGQIRNGSFNYVDITQKLLEIKDAKGMLKHFYALFANDRKPREARIVLDILKGLERKANPRLALDLMCIRLLSFP